MHSARSCKASLPRTASRRRAAGQLLLSTDAVETGAREVAYVAIERLDIETGRRTIALRSTDHDELRRELARARTGDAALLPLIQAIERWCGRALACGARDTALSGAERLRQLLLEYGYDARLARDAREIAHWGRPGKVEVRVAAISGGFALPLARTVVSEEEIFGPRERRRTKVSLREARRSSRSRSSRPATPWCTASTASASTAGSCSSPWPARGEPPATSSCASSTMAAIDSSCPCTASRWCSATSVEGVPPRLDKLGGVTWEKAKRHVKKSLREWRRTARHPRRARAGGGFSFSPRDRALEEFEGTSRTRRRPTSRPRSRRARRHADGKPMDRLVCGDVGFGKTE